MAVKKDEDRALQQPQTMAGEKEVKGGRERAQGEMMPDNEVAEEATVFDIILN